MPGRRNDMDMAGVMAAIMAPASAPPAAMSAISIPAAMSPPASAMSWSTLPRGPRPRPRSRPGTRGEQSTGVSRRRGAVRENSWKRIVWSSVYC